MRSREGLPVKNVPSRGIYVCRELKRAINGRFNGGAWELGGKLKA